MTEKRDFSINVWLDDLRDPAVFDKSGTEWFWAKTVPEAKSLLETAEVKRLSLDNDLGPDEEEGRRLVLWMAEFEVWPEGPISVHSANPVARDYMLGMLDRYAPDECDILHP